MISHTPKTHPCVGCSPFNAAAKTRPTIFTCALRSAGDSVKHFYVALRADDGPDLGPAVAPALAHGGRVLALANLTRRQRELLEEFERESSGENNPESAGFFARVRDFFDNLGS